MTYDEWRRRMQEEADKETEARERRMIERIMRAIENDALYPEPAVRLARCPICSGKGTIHLEPHALDDHDAP